MIVERLNSWSAGSRWQDEDMYHMGTRISANVIILHHSHTTELARYIIVYNPLTGERIKIEFGIE